jgi:hypothetical protein
MLGDLGRAQGSGQGFAGEIYLCGRFADLSAVAGDHGINRGADLFGYPLRGPDMVGTGRSRAACARLAGVGDTIFRYHHPCLFG